MFNVLITTGAIQWRRLITCYVSVEDNKAFHVWNISSRKMAQMITDLDTQSFNSMFSVLHCIFL